MQQTPAPAGFGRGYTESRIATQDGYLWPIERRLMQSPGAIRERMVEDIGALVNDGGQDAVVTQECLVRLKGWPRTSVEAHASIAFAYFKAANGPRKTRRTLGGRDTVAGAMVEAAAISCFTFAALLWAGIGAGVI